MDKSNFYKKFFDDSLSLYYLARRNGSDMKIQKGFIEIYNNTFRDMKEIPEIRKIVPNLEKVLKEAVSKDFLDLRGFNINIDNPIDSTSSQKHFC